MAQPFEHLVRANSWQTGRQLRLDQSHDRANRTSFLAVCAKRDPDQNKTTSGGSLVPRPRLPKLRRGPGTHCMRMR